MTEPSTFRRIGFVGLLVLTACGDGGAGPSGPPPLLTGLPRPLSAAEAGIAAASNRFAFGLLARAQAADPDATVFLSPLSASMALGMTLNGAHGNTRTQMAATLGFGGLTEGEINAGYQDLLALLASLDRTTEIRVANSIWAQTGFPFLPGFADAGRTWFNAEVRNVSFSDPATLGLINGWVRDRTSNKIPTLLERIDPQTAMTLLNAVYFKGAWRTAFKPAETHSEEFHGTGGSQSAAMMHREGTILYAESSRYQAVDLLYGNGGFGMTIVLPRQGVALGAALGGDPAAEWSALTSRLSGREVTLSLPRFRLDYRRDLTGDLKSMGMPLAFDPLSADFTRMAAPPIQLFLSSVQQKTMVEVNEEGTVAAAATAVQVGVTSVPVSVEVRVDRPFIVAIRERFSGTLLFLGQVTAIPPT